ncbi:MAG: hypothetical protein ACI84R_002616 [Candidatus Azotimanducaceae bacterium]|jgi:hypothetical protein
MIPLLTEVLQLVGAAIMLASAAPILKKCTDITQCNISTVRHS